VTLLDSFHGRTVTTLSATGQKKFHNYFFPFTEGFTFVEANNIPALTELFRNDSSICGLLIEPVQGEGGVRALDTEFVRTAARLCAEYDVLLMADEVQTGAGRTGTFFCCESFGVVPDVITLAKGLGAGLPIGVCLSGRKAADTLAPGTHGTTFGANPAVCAGALYVAEKLSQPEFLLNVRENAAYARERLGGFKAVREVTGMGLMIGLLLEGITPQEAVLACMARGLLPLTANGVLRLLPPLNITREVLCEGLDILEDVLK